MKLLLLSFVSLLHFAGGKGLRALAAPKKEPKVKGPPDKGEICHFVQDTGDYTLLYVPFISAHDTKHPLDGRPGERVPEMNEYGEVVPTDFCFSDACTIVTCAGAPCATSSAACTANENAICLHNVCCEEGYDFCPADVSACGPDNYDYAHFMWCSFEYKDGEFPEYVPLPDSFSGSAMYDGNSLTIELKNAVPDRKYRAYAHRPDRTTLLYVNYPEGIKDFSTDASGAASQTFTFLEFDTVEEKPTDYASVLIQLVKTGEHQPDPPDGEVINEYTFWQMSQIATPFGVDIFPK